MKKNLIIAGMVLTVCTLMPVCVHADTDLKVLTRDDFIVNVENDEELKKYDNDVISSIDAYYDGGYNLFFYTEDNFPEEKNIGQVIFSRGIELGESTKEDLLNAYGVGISTEFNESTDLAFSGENWEEDVDVYMKEIEKTLTESIFYNYKDLYQIIFFISVDDKINCVYIMDGIYYEADKNTVKEVQAELNAQGYNCGTPDGIIGNNTKSSILAYQKVNGLFTSGAVDDELLKSLAVTSKSDQSQDTTTIEDNITENNEKTIAMPDGMIIDEDEWNAWKSSNVCSLFPFMEACEKVNCSFSLPSGQQENHKEGKFLFNDGGTQRTLDIADFYYGVENQRVNYVGLKTDNETDYLNQDFREACIRLMLAYNIHYDSSTDDAVLNLSRERAEEIVNYCFDNNIKHCLVDNMRIRLLRNDTGDNYYSFHMEY